VATRWPSRAGDPEFDRRGRRAGVRSRRTAPRPPPAAPAAAMPEWRLAVDQVGKLSGTIHLSTSFFVASRFPFSSLRCLWPRKRLLNACESGSAGSRREGAVRRHREPASAHWLRSPASVGPTITVSPGQRRGSRQRESRPAALPSCRGFPVARGHDHTLARPISPGESHPLGCSAASKSRP